MLGVMKNFLSNLQNYLFTGILLLGNFGLVISDPVNTKILNPNSANENLLTEENEDGGESKPEPFDFGSDLIIKALNPSDGSNVGEFIELYNTTDDVLALAGYELIYTGSGKPTPVFTFPEGSVLTGKHLLLRFDKSPEEDFDVKYKLGTYGMAQDAGKLELYYGDDDTPVDQICWTIKETEDCVKKVSKSTETVTRNLSDGTFGLIAMDDYEFPTIDPEHPNYVVFLPNEQEDPDEVSPPQCLGLEFSELLTYYAEDKSEQFIEFFNPMNEDILLAGCKVSFKNKLYNLSGEVKSGGYYVYHQSVDFTLTKNPTNPLTLTLVDANGEILDAVTYAKGQKSSTSYAKFVAIDGAESWEITYAITPGQENIYQRFKSCEEGKIINEATGNCIKAPEVKDDGDENSASSTKTLAECPEGKYRNPLTNRCKTIETVSSTTLAECPEGKYRNPLTNRCKSIETASTTLKECAEGYERNLETNRCRKVTSTSGNDGADYGLVTKIKSDKTTFVGLSIVIMIMLVGLGYVVLQFRREILRAARKARQRINHVVQNLLARKIGGDGKQKS